MVGLRRKNDWQGKEHRQSGDRQVVSRLGRKSGNLPIECHECSLCHNNAEPYFTKHALLILTMLAGGQLCVPPIRNVDEEATIDRILSC
jgi:hypothetical protein